MLLDPKRYMGRAQDAADRLLLLAQDVRSALRGWRLGDLADTNLHQPAPTNGQALVYNAATRAWKPGTVATSGGGNGTPTSGFLAHNVAAISVTTTGNYTLPFDTQDYDYGNEFNPATGTWTPTTSGPYEVFGQIMLNTVQTATGCQYLRLVEDLGLGTERDAGSFFHGSIDNAGDGSVIPQKMGATIQVMITAGKTYNVVVGNLLNPTTVSPTETLFGAVQIAAPGAGMQSGFRAYKSTNYVLGGAGFFSVVYGTQEYDELGEYDPATGWFRPTVTGMYLIMASLQTSATLGATQRLHMDLMKDNGGAGVLVSSMGDTPGANDANADRHIGSVIVPLVAGSDYYVNNYCSTAATFQGGTEYLWFAGKRLI